MKTIAFDARLIRHPGIGRYLRSLLGAMLAAKPPYAFRLIGPARDLERYAASGAAVAPCEIPPYGLAEQLGMGAYFRDADLVHVPHFNAPCFGPAPNLVVTIHDLIYFRVKEYEPFPGARIALKAALARVLSRARRVIAVSEATKSDLSARFPGVAAKCRVIHEAADPVFAATGRGANGASSGIERPYVLSVGSIREHKNAHTLLAAYEELWAKSRTEAGIVFVGKLDSRFDQKHRFRERIQKLPRARWLGEVPDSDLGALYAGAACFVMPSFYEGFGLPVLEAMASAVPVISSDTPALAEVAGDAALQFPPRQIDRLSQLLYNVLQDRELREKLIEKGKRRVSFFSWERAARETLDVYGEILGR